jgi:hypothetical protein
MGAVLAMTGTLAATTLVSAPKAEQTKDEAAAEEILPKDAVRLATWSPPAPATADPPEPDEIDALATGSLFFVGRPLTPPARFDTHSEPIVAISRFGPWIASPAEWREEEFDQVAVLDGRTLEVGAVHIQLLGLDLPLSEQVCRTLDGRFEPCAVRAATQLELLTRHRKVTCHYRADLARETIGRCRIGTNDLAERMVQTGYVWRSAAVTP